MPAGKVVHAIMDNYAAHKHPEVLAWLADNPRWTVHFTPTSCSWLNTVEGFFSKPTRQALQRGVFRSVDDLVATIDRYISQANDIRDLRTDRIRSQHHDQAQDEPAE